MVVEREGLVSCLLRLQPLRPAWVAALAIGWLLIQIIVAVGAGAQQSQPTPEQGVASAIALAVQIVDQATGSAGNRSAPDGPTASDASSAWDQFGPHLLAVSVAVLFQAGLIAWLLYERRRRLRSEAQARETMAQLAQINRIATAGELSASIAHELTQPITGMMASANAALRWLSSASPDLDKARLALTQVVDAGGRAVELIRSVRAIFKRGGDERRPVSLNDLITAVLGLVETNLRARGIAVELQLDRGRPVVNGDQVQLQQVLLNLVTNAMDAMADVSSRPRVLHITTELRQDDVQVTVADTGIGISDKDIDQVFKPLFTTKRGGMGMGLAICRRIIEAHHGHIWVLPGSQGGAAFYILLPLVSVES